MQELKALAAAALLAAILVPVDARASAPAGVWVKVQEVVYTPDATSPTHVQIHGAIMLYDGDVQAPRPYLGYTSPALGYMYYRCPDGQAEICRDEWSDLEANIAKPDTECLGFGMTSLPTGTLRRADEAPQNPDTYPIQSGVSPGFSPCQAIANYLADDVGAGGGGGTASSGGVSSGGVSSGGASSGGVSSNPGGAPASTSGASARPPGGASGAAAGAPSNSGTTAGRPGSGGTRLDPEEPSKDTTSESRAAGCSIAHATGAASLLGLAAAGGAFVLALARRNRRRQ